MKKAYILFISIISMLLFSCSTEISGEGSISTQTYSTASNYTKVSVDADIDVTITHGSTKKVYLTGYDNLLDYVKLTATGGILKIGMKPDYNYSNMNLSAVVVMPSYTELIVTSSGSIEVDSFANHIPDLILQISGTGDITTMHHPIVGNLSVNINGTGSVNINGGVTDETINLSGMGNYNGFGMGSNNSIVNLSGSGSAQVSPKLLLTATIGGSGNVYYKRNPSIDSTITGTGTVINSN